MSPAAQYIVQATITLVGIGLLGALLVAANRRWASARPSGPLSLVGQLPLDSRRSVYLVQAGKRVYLLAASDHGVVKLGEVDRSELPDEIMGAPRSFAAILQGAMGRHRSDDSPAGTDVSGSAGTDGSSPPATGDGTGSRDVTLGDTGRRPA